MQKINLSTPYTVEELTREANKFNILALLGGISVATILVSFLIMLFCIAVGHTNPYVGISLEMLLLATLIGFVICILVEKVSENANIAVNLQLLTKDPHLCKKLNDVMQIPELAHYICLVRKQKRDLTLCELEMLSEMAVSYKNSITAAKAAEKAKAAILKVEQVCAEHCLHS